MALFEVSGDELLPHTPAKFKGLEIHDETDMIRTRCPCLRLLEQTQKSCSSKVPSADCSREELRVGIWQRRETRRCEFCGKRFAAPSSGESTQCPRCHLPGPWASEEEIESARVAELKKLEAQEQAERGEEWARIWGELRVWYDEWLRKEVRYRAALELRANATPGFIAQKGELPYFSTAALLFEFRRDAESPTGQNWVAVDSGKAVITDKRIVFLGETLNAEWAFSKLVGIDVMTFEGDIDVDLSMVRLLATSRPKGDALRLDDADAFMATFEASIARFRGVPPPQPEPASTFEEIEATLAELVSSVPSRSRALIADAIRTHRGPRALERLDLERLGIEPALRDSLLEVGDTPTLRDLLAELMDLEPG